MEDENYGTDLTETYGNYGTDLTETYGNYGTDLMLIWSGVDGPRGAICEVYSPPRVAAAAWKMGEVPGWSLDLTTADNQ